MPDPSLGPEEADSFEENLHRLNDEIQRMRAEQAVQSELVLALADRMLKLETQRALPRPFTERR